MTIKTVFKLQVLKRKNSSFDNRSALRYYLDGGFVPLGDFSFCRAGPWTPHATVPGITPSSAAPLWCRRSYNKLSERFRSADRSKTSTLLHPPCFLLLTVTWRSRWTISRDSGSTRHRGSCSFLRQNACRYYFPDYDRNLIIVIIIIFTLLVLAYIPLTNICFFNWQMQTCLFKDISRSISFFN